MSVAELLCFFYFKCVNKYASWENWKCNCIYNSKVLLHKSWNTGLLTQFHFLLILYVFMRGLVPLLWMFLQSNYSSSHLSGWKCQPYKGWWPSLLIFAKPPTYWLKSQRIMSLSHALLTSGLEVRSGESDVLAWSKICRE